MGQMNDDIAEYSDEVTLFSGPENIILKKV